MSLDDVFPDTWTPVGPHGARKTEDFAHAEIHNGNVFHVEKTGTVTTTATVMITTAATPEIHIQITLNADDAGKVELFEAPAATGGTPITPINANRKSAVVSGLAASTHTPTITTTGSVLETIFTGAAGFPSGGSGSGEVLGTTWILDASTKYLIRYTPATTANSIFGAIVVRD